jgi:hypothetical protein
LVVLCPFSYKGALMIPRQGQIHSYKNKFHVR